MRHGSPHGVESNQTPVLTEGEHTSKNTTKQRERGTHPLSPPRHFSDLTIGITADCCCLHQIPHTPDARVPLLPPHSSPLVCGLISGPPSHPYHTKAAQQPHAWQHINQGARFQIQDDRTIAPPSFPGEIIQAHHPNVFDGWSENQVEGSKKGRSGEVNAQLLT